MQNKTEKEQTVYVYLGDLVAILCVFIVGVFLIVGGAVYGIEHCRLTHCQAQVTLPDVRP